MILRIYSLFSLPFSILLSNSGAESKMKQLDNMLLVIGG